MSQNDWLYEIKPKGKLLSLNFREVWAYRDLLMLFVKRDIVTVYKQTILGPLWYFIQPLFTSVIFTLIFNRVGKIDTGGVPPFLFNLAGITLWNYFKECLTSTSSTFTTNAAIFGKVYFPRVIMPLSKILSNLLKFGIQLLIFAVFYIYYTYFVDQTFSMHFEEEVIFFPFIVLIMGTVGLGLGLILSALTTKYRDLQILIGFGVSLLMYLSAVMYPISEIADKMGDYFWVVKYNPLAQVIEAFRYMTLSEGTFSWLAVGVSSLVALGLFLLGVIIFNKTERSFIDTV